MIVLDASVFAKLFLDEPDRPQVETLVEHAISSDVALIAPTLLLYEALSIGIRHDVPFSAILGLLDKLSIAGLTMDEPTITELERAEQIAKVGNRASGYPALGDSIYHAMAINRSGVFVTADQRHFGKTRQFGSVVLLADWKPS